MYWRTAGQRRWNASGSCGEFELSMDFHLLTQPTPGASHGRSVFSPAKLVTHPLVEPLWFEQRNSSGTRHQIGAFDEVTGACICSYAKIGYSKPKVAHAGKERPASGRLRNTNEEDRPESQKWNRIQAPCPAFRRNGPAFNEFQG